MSGSDPVDIDEFGEGSQPPDAALGGDFDMRQHDQVQAPLFPTEESIVPESLRTMRKAVAAIHATAAKVEHAQSLNNRRLLDACILIAQVECRTRGAEFLERVKAERVSPLFETRVSELARLASIPGKNYQRIYEELDALFEMVLNWNIVGEDAETQWAMKSHFLSTLGHGRGLKRGLIRFSIDPSILEIVLEPSNWATLSLQVMQGLGTATSYALYQNAWRYINTSAKVTAALPVATWVELLMGKCSYIEEDAKGAKRVVRYADFKRRHLVDALRRVNDISALGYTLELREIKSGTRVIRLQFKFVPKKSLGLGIPMTWPRDVVTALRSLGFSADEIGDLSQARSYEEVAETLVKFKQAEERMRAQGRPISSPKAYFGGILANIAAGKDLDDEEQARIESEVRAQEAQRESAQRQERLREEFGRHMATRFAQELFALPAPEREGIIQAFSTADEGRRAQPFLTRGWSDKNPPALALLRDWLSRTKPEVFEALLPHAHDRNYEGWLAWRADRAGPAS